MYVHACSIWYPLSSSIESFPICIRIHSKEGNKQNVATCTCSLYEPNLFHFLRCRSQVHSSLFIAMTGEKRRLKVSAGALPSPKLAALAACHPFSKQVGSILNYIGGFSRKKDHLNYASCAARCCISLKCGSTFSPRAAEDEL